MKYLYELQCKDLLHQVLNKQLDYVLCMIILHDHAVLIAGIKNTRHFKEGELK